MSGDARIVGRDVAMVRQGHEQVKDIHRHDVPYIMEDVRIGYVRQGSAGLTVSLIDRDVEGGMPVFIGAGCIMQSYRRLPQV